MATIDRGPAEVLRFFGVDPGKPLGDRAKLGDYLGIPEVARQVALRVLADQGREP